MHLPDPGSSHGMRQRLSFLAKYIASDLDTFRKAFVKIRNLNINKPSKRDAFTPAPGVPYFRDYLSVFWPFYYVVFIISQLQAFFLPSKYYVIEIACVLSIVNCEVVPLDLTGHEILNVWNFYIGLRNYFRAFLYEGLSGTSHLMISKFAHFEIRSFSQIAQSTDTCLRGRRL